MAEFKKFSRQFMAERNRTFSGDDISLVARFQSEIEHTQRDMKTACDDIANKLGPAMWLRGLDKKHLTNDKLPALKTDYNNAKLLQLYLDEQFYNKVEQRIKSIFSTGFQNPLNSEIISIVQIVPTLQDGKL